MEENGECEDQIGGSDQIMGPSQYCQSIACRDRQMSIRSIIIHVVQEVFSTIDLIDGWMHA
jgi:hypothetical protein